MTEQQKPLYVTDPERAKALAEYEKYIAMNDLQKRIYNRERGILTIDGTNNLDVKGMADEVAKWDQAEADYQNKLSIKEKEKAERLQRENEEFMRKFAETVQAEQSSKAQQELQKLQEENEAKEQAFRDEHNIGTDSNASYKKLLENL